MQEHHSGNFYAFSDGRDSYALDIVNSRAFRPAGGLEAPGDPAAPPLVQAYAPLDYMRAQLCVTHLCNLRCRYCKLDGGKAAGRIKKMDLATAQRAIRHILARRPAGLGKIVISLTSNGETLTNFDMVEELIDCCDRIGEAARCRFYFNFATNGTLLTRSILDRILAHENLAIFFSVDGSEAEHARLRPYADGSASYRDVMAAVQMYAEATRGNDARQLASSTVLTTYNLDIPAIFRNLLALGFRDVLTRPARSRPEWEFGLHAETLRSYEDAYTKFYEFLSGSIDQGTTAYIDSMPPAYDFFARPVFALMLHERKLHCAPHLPPVGTGATLRDFSLTYDADGSILCPCRDVIGVRDFRIGSLDEGIDEQALAFIEQMGCEGKSECSRCWARYLCGGGCHLHGYCATGETAKPDKVMCELTRHVARLGVKFVVHLAEEHDALYAHLKERAMKRVPWHAIYGR